MLKVGATAPLFAAESTKGHVNLEELRGTKNVVMIFYPGDDTPVCTKQLCSVQNSYKEFEHVDTVVLGINPAEIAKHESFSRKFGYQFPLIYDQDDEIRKKYNVGKILGFIAQQRIVYIINKAGQIVFARKGNPSTSELLQVIKNQT